MRMLHKKHFNILLFPLFTIIIYIIILISIDGNKKIIEYIPNLVYKIPGGYGNQLERSIELSNIREDSIDVMFLGSSHSYRGFDPRKFNKVGISTFNLGNSQQTPINTYFLLEEYLDQVKPKFVIFEIFWQTLQVKDYGVESALDLIINSPISWSKVKMAIATKDLLVTNVLIQNYISRLFTPIESYVKESSNYVSGGYVTNTSKLNEKTTQNLTGRKWSLKAHQIEYLQKCINLLKEKDIDFILLTTPVTQELIEAHQNRKEIFDTINALSKFNGLKHINYALDKTNNRLQLESKKHFYDNNHLNQKGVDIFNDDLIFNLFNNFPSFDRYKTKSNLIKNGDFSNGLKNWRIKGDSLLITKVRNGVQIKSKGDLTGISQFCLKPNTPYKVGIHVGKIKKGGLQLYTGYSKVTDLKEGMNTIEFTSNDKTSFHIYRTKETDAVLKNVYLIETEIKNNLVRNGQFRNGLDGWEIKGNSDGIKVLSNGVQIKTPGEIIGLTQFPIEPFKKYKVEIYISKSIKGKLKFFTGYNKVKTLENGMNVFEFTSGDKSSVHIYRNQGETNVILNSIKITKLK